MGWIHPLRPVPPDARMVEGSLRVELGDFGTMQKKTAYLGFEHHIPTGMPSRCMTPKTPVHLKTQDGLKRKRKSRLNLGGLGGLRLD